MSVALDLCPKAIAQRLRSIGVSTPYAYQIAHGSREPSLALAAKIARETGMRLGVLKHANDEEVAVVVSLVDRST